MDIVNDVESIVQTIKEKNPKIVGIDGIDGAGKTEFSEKLKRLSFIVISLDDYLDKNAKGYFNFINFDNLSKDLKNYQKDKIVIEGVLLQKVLAKLELKCDFILYLTDSIWIYDWLEEYSGKYFGKTLEQIISDAESNVNKVGRATSTNFKEYKMTGLRKEIYQYTFQFKPWEKADLVGRL